MWAKRERRWAGWGIILALAALCTGLAVMQYRWTGALALAEQQRLGGSLAERAEDMTQEFDATLSAACLSLTPTAREVATLGASRALQERITAWLGDQPQPIFRRMGIVVPRGDSLELNLSDGKAAAPRVTEQWPEEWAKLERHLRGGRGGGPGPFFDSNGILLEFPIQGFDKPTPWAEKGDSAGKRRDGGWGRLILELDMDYVSTSWLPALAARHLESGGMNEARVTGAGRRLFATPGAVGDVEASAREAATTLPFHLAGRPAMASFFKFRGFWTLEAWRRAGELGAAVSASRWRNFGISLGLTALIFLAALLLVGQARRTRALADMQMNFVAAVSHELRTPVTVIRGAAHNLERGIAGDPARVKQYAGVITRHAEELSEMVGQVLDFAATQNQEVAFAAPVNLPELLHECAAATQAEIDAAKCSVEFDLPPDLPPVKGDRDALCRVFRNLIGNAAKHGGAGGWIGLSVTAQKGSVSVQVRDRGPGIPPEEQVVIFDPFVRGRTAREQQIRGSGLGLSLVRQVIHAHRGTITVISTPGSGSCFTVTLPSA